MEWAWLSVTLMVTVRLVGGDLAVWRRLLGLGWRRWLSSVSVVRPLPALTVVDLPPYLPPPLTALPPMGGLAPLAAFGGLPPPLEPLLLMLPLPEPMLPRPRGS